MAYVITVSLADLPLLERAVRHSKGCPGSRNLRSRALHPCLRCVRRRGNRRVVLGLSTSARLPERIKRVKKYILFDHDGVLVDTEFWYYKAGERALADIGLTLDKDQYLRDMNQGLGTWAQARAAGIDEQTISRQRKVRNDYYQEYLRTEAIEIEGVVDTLAELSNTSAWPS